MSSKINKLIFKIIIVVFGILVIGLMSLWMIRVFSDRQVDDVNPLMNCSSLVLQKTDVFAVVPIFKGVSIAENKSWCDKILAMNKTLIMHGVYHYYNEFEGDINESYVKLGMEEFKKCFGYYPTYFEAPQLAISYANEEIVERAGFELRGYPYQITHKIYHCGDSGTLKNGFIDLF